MRTIIETPIDAAKLPPEVRANLAAGTLVRVSLEILTDENGFTPQQVADIEAAIEESRDPANLIGPMEANEALAYLRAIADKQE